MNTRTTQHTFFGSRPDQLGQDAPDMAKSLQFAQMRKSKIATKAGNLDHHMHWLAKNAQDRENVRKMEDEATLHAKVATATMSIGIS